MRLKIIVTLIIFLFTLIGLSTLIDNMDKESSYSYNDKHENRLQSVAKSR